MMMIQNPLNSNRFNSNKFHKIQFASTRAERDQALSKGPSDIPDVRYYLNIDVQHCDSWGSAMRYKREAFVWDSEQQGFVHRTEMFSQFADGRREKAKVTENPLLNNTVLSQQIYVDVENKRLLLPNGYFMDGPTGKMYTCQGVDMATFNQNNSVKEI
jgi:hypothetical protein